MTTKKLSVFSLVMINIIAIDSLRNLPINAEYGLSIIGLYLIGALLFLLPCILITAELATHHPETGGSFVWVNRAFGQRMGFMNSWLQWIYNVVWFPTILSFIGATIAYLINPALAINKTYMVSMILSLFTLATIANAFGMKVSSFVSTIGAIVGTIIPMLLITGLGAAWIHMGKPLSITCHLGDLLPSFSHFHNIAFMIVILFSLIGIEMSAVHAGDVQSPKRDFPRALLISSVFILLSMMAASVAVAIIIPKGQLNIVSGLNAAFAAFLAQFHLSALLPVVLCTIIIGAFAGLAAWVLGPAKALMIAAKEGAAPALLGRQNRFNAPSTLLLTQLLIVFVLCALFYGFDSISTSYWLLSDLTAQLALVYYIILFAAAIKLRKQTPRDPLAYRIPGGNWGIKLVAGVGILTCCVAIVLGFIPPADMHITHLARFESVLIMGMLFFLGLPWVITHGQRARKPLQYNR